MSPLKSVLLLLAMLAAGATASAQSRPDTLEYRMLDSTDADNIPAASDGTEGVDIDTFATEMPEEEIDEADMTHEEKLRYGKVEHSLYDRQPLDGFDESAQMRLTPRQPDSATLAEIREDGAYKYPAYRAEKDWRPEWVKDLSAWAAGHLKAIRNLMLISFGALIVLIIVLFMSRSDIPVFRWRAARTNGTGEAMEAENLQADLEAMAASARNAGQLRDAVRFRYLHALQLLEQGGLIVRAKDKTNMDYLRELSRTGFHQAFALITLQYEYVWYGKMPISEVQFGRVNAAFDDFKNSLPK